jgi:hypothetical protein
MPPMVAPENITFMPGQNPAVLAQVMRLLEAVVAVHVTTAKGSVLANKFC